MSARVRLDPMTAAEYDAFAAEGVANYAAEKVASGQWSAEEASAQAAQAFASLLPQGPATPDNHLFTVRDVGDGAAVGVVWFAIQPRANHRIAYLYEIRLGAEHQGRGLGEATMRALEAEVAGRGLAGIGLHVFGHNARARALYEKLGYAATNVVMYKPL